MESNINTALDTHAVLDPIVAISDANEKILHLITGLTDRYSFQCDATPSYETIEKYHDMVRQDVKFYENPIVDNCEVWLHHYRSIMLQLGMICDYAERIKKEAVRAETALDKLDE